MIICQHYLSCVLFAVSFYRSCIYFSAQSICIIHFLFYFLLYLICLSFSSLSDYPSALHRLYSYNTACYSIDPNLTSIVLHSPITSSQFSPHITLYPLPFLLFYVTQLLGFTPSKYPSRPYCSSSPLKRSGSIEDDGYLNSNSDARQRNKNSIWSSFLNRFRDTQPGTLILVRHGESVVCNK